MTRLRIYSAGTGRLQFDSSGSAADVTESSVKRDFKSDLLLYYDPNRNGLRCYVKLVRSGSEQFMADYEYDADQSDPLASFKSTLEREITDVGWRVEDDAGYEQQVYESIGSVNEVSPDVSKDDLEFLRSRVGQIRIGTPDEARAVGVVSYLRRVFDDSLDIAISYSGETGTHSSVDAVIIPGATESVTVTRDQRAALARRRLNELQGAVSSTGMGGAVSTMRRALVDAGGEDRLGLAIEARNASVPGSAAGKRNAVLTALVLVPLAFLAVIIRVGSDQLLPALTRQQGFYLPLAGVLNDALPFGVPSYLFDFTSWHVILISTFVVGIALVITPPVQRTLTALTGVSIPGFGGAVGNGGPTPADSAQRAIDELVTLQRIAGNDGRDQVNSVLSEFGLETGSRSTRARTALGVQAVGVVAGLLVAVATFFVASMAARVVFPLLVDQWILVLDLFIVGLTLGVVGTLGAAGFVLVSDFVGGNNRTHRRTSGGTSVQGPASRRQPSFNVDSFEKQIRSNPQQAVRRAEHALDVLRTCGHTTPNKRTTRVANALNTLSKKVAPNQFRLDGNDRRLVDHHADTTNATQVLNDLTRGQPTQRSHTDPSRTTQGSKRQSTTDQNRNDTQGRSSDDQPRSSDDQPRSSDDQLRSSDERSGSGDERREDTGEADDDDLLYSPDQSSDAGDESTSSIDRLDVTGVDPDPDAGSETEGSDRSNSGDGGDADPFRNGRTTSDSDLVSATGTTAPKTETGTANASEDTAFVQFRCDAANTGTRPENAPIRTPTQAWPPVPLDEECTTTPLVWREYLLVGTRAGRLHAVSRVDGTHEFVTALDAALVATPALVGDHLVVVTVDGTIAGYALDERGERLVAHRAWHDAQRVASAGTPATAAPTVAGSRVIVAGGDGRVHALDGTTGESYWDVPYESGDEIALSAPAIDDECVYIADTAGTLHAVDANDGTERWSRPLGGHTVFASPAVDDGRIVVGDVSGTLWVVDAEEERIVADVSTGDEIVSSPALSDGIAYVVSNVDGSVSAGGSTAPSTSGRAVVTAVDVNRPTHELWDRHLETMTVSSPTVVGDDLFVGTAGGSLVGLGCRDGDDLWGEPLPLATDCEIEASVAVAEGGLYVPDHDGTVWGVVDESR